MSRALVIALAVTLAACSESTKPDDLDLSAIAFAYAADTSLNSNLDIFVMPPDGSNVRRVVSSSESEALPDWSPDGQTLLFTRFTRGTSRTALWTVRADGSELREITAGVPGGGYGGRWSPDGKSIVFRTAAAPSNLAVMNADGTGWHLIAPSIVKDAYTAPDWAPDGRITFSRYTDKGSQGIWTINPDGTGLSLFTDREDGEPRWSPDGTHLVFTTQLYSGSSAIQVLFEVNADGSDRRQVTSGPSDRSPEWSPDGKWVIFDRILLGGSRPPCAMFRMPGTGGVAVNIQPARTRIACEGSSWRNAPAAVR